MTTEMDKIKNLRVLIQTTLKQIKYEDKNHINYKNILGCDKENFKRIFKIFYSFQRLKDKELFKQSLYTTLYVLWTRIDKDEKVKFLQDSKNPQLCNNFDSVEETFAALDLICKWVELNAFTENKGLSYIIYDLDNEPENDNETNLTLLPKINAKIQEINKKLATYPEDLKLMTLLYELIVMFHKLKSTSTMADSHAIAIIYGSNYYRNIYSAILLFWKFIEKNVPNIQKHNKYDYIVMNMSVLEKTDIQNKLMNTITRAGLKKLKSFIPKNPENVDKLKNANFEKILNSNIARVKAEPMKRPSQKTVKKGVNLQKTSAFHNALRGSFLLASNMLLKSTH